MADQANRGGKKRGAAKDPGGQKHVGVRPGSSARDKDRDKQGARRKVVPDKD